MAKAARQSSASPKKENEQTRTKYNPNIWGMIQNILIHSMNRGQLFLAGIFLIILISIVKLESKELFNIYHEIFEIIKTLKYFGWFFAFLLMVTWFIIGTRSNKVHIEQINKLLEENEKLHQQLLNRA